MSNLSAISYAAKSNFLFEGRFNVNLAFSLQNFGLESFVLLKALVASESEAFTRSTSSFSELRMAPHFFWPITVESSRIRLNVCNEDLVGPHI